jgi:hypothetical protein
MTTTEKHYDQSLHATVRTVTRSQYAVYRVIAHYIPTRETSEIYRTPYYYLARDFRRETIKNLSTCPGKDNWVHWCDTVYVVTPEPKTARAAK